jgi:zinc transport system substrate-binding protein
LTGFQPWVDNIKTDLEADGAGVKTVDVSTGLNLLEAGKEHTDEKHTGDEHTDDEHTDDEHTDDEHTDDEHTDDHGSGMDPHFWMDPLRVKEATGNVRQGFVDIDPENADAYVANAEAFRGQLDMLHEQIETLLTDASKGVLLVAGHDSLQYFSNRYGVKVEALTNVSPDDRPTPKDIERAQEVIETNDLRYICADPLESQRAATQLVAETSAEAVLPLTAMPGLTEEWESKGWGYIDVMEKVNIPTIKRALDAQ